MIFSLIKLKLDFAKIVHASAVGRCFLCTCVNGYCNFSREINCFSKFFLGEILKVLVSGNSRLDFRVSKLDLFESSILILSCNAPL